MKKKIRELDIQEFRAARKSVAKAYVLTRKAALTLELLRYDKRITGGKSTEGIEHMEYAADIAKQAKDALLALTEDLKLISRKEDIK